MGTAQVVLVTGSSSGFGQLIAQTLARRGHTVFAGIRASAGRNAAAADDLRALGAREGWSLRVVDLDVTDDASVDAAMQAVVDAAGRLDTVVNNAGAAFLGPLEAFSTEQARQQFEVNFFGVLRMNRAALPQMRAQGSGLLLQVGSLVGRQAFPFMGLYGATKFALEGLTESLRYELAPLGVDAAIVEPGTYPTRINENRAVPADGERVGAYLAAMGTFLGRLFGDGDGTPPDSQEVADAVVRLIELPAGERPLRTVVAIESQAAPILALNEGAAQAARALLGSLGVADLVTLAPRSRETAGV